MRMTVGEYIQKKYGSNVRTLTAIEAKFFAINYPLRSGWYEDRCEYVFNASDLASFLKNSRKRIKNEKTSASINAGLRAIGCSDTTGTYVSNAAGRKQKKERRRASKMKINEKYQAFDAEGRIRAGTLINAYGVEMVVIPRYDNGSTWGIDESGAVVECKLDEIVII